MTERPYPTLTDADRAALQAFADAHGRNWKNELGDVYWYNARVWRGPDGTQTHGYALHGIRNNFGPSWLWDVCDIKHTPKPKKAGGNKAALPGLTNKLNALFTKKAK